MNRKHEKLLVAALAGLVIASAAAFAVQPALAAGYDVQTPAQVNGVAAWDHLNVRLWPASYSQQVGQLDHDAPVWVERCIIAPQGGADWCLVDNGDTQGWVNANYLHFFYDTDI
jgi:uncharacterized protein YraI